MEQTLYAMEPSILEREQWNSFKILDKIKQVVQVDQLVKMLDQLQMIKSRIAKLFIMDAVTKFPDRFTLAQTRDRWIEETQVFQEIDERGKEMFYIENTDIKMDRERHFDQSVYFGVHVASHVRLGVIADRDVDDIYTPEDVEPSLVCDYEWYARNPIIMLLSPQKRCHCACFAFYMAAAFEEMGRANDIRLCLLPGHLTVILVKPVFDVISAETDLHVITHWKEWNFVDEKSSPFTLEKGDIVKRQFAFALIELAMAKTPAVWIQLRDKQNHLEFRDKYCSDLARKRVILSNYQPDGLENLVCVFRGIDPYWNSFAILMFETAFKRRMWDAFRLWILVGYMYDMNHFVDVMIRKTLMKLQRIKLVICATGRCDENGPVHLRVASHLEMTGADEAVRNAAVGSTWRQRFEYRNRVFGHSFGHSRRLTPLERHEWIQQLEKEIGLLALESVDILKKNMDFKSNQGFIAKLANVDQTFKDAQGENL